MLLDSFESLVESGPLADCLAHRVGERWAVFSRSQVWEAAEALVAAWQSEGLSPGDRVLIMMENRPEWAVVAIAAAYAGWVLVPAYTTHSDAEVKYLIDQTEPKAVIASEGFADRLSQLMPNALSHWVGGASDALNVPAPNEGSLPARFDATADSLYALIATSGTNGLPKIAMLSQGNLRANVASILEILRDADLLKPQRFLSFLPLAHAYEHMAGLHLPLAMGSSIYYCEKLERLPGDMAVVKPTLMTAVPRLYELLHSKIELQVAQSSRLKQALFKTTLRLGAKSQSEMSAFERILNGLCERLVRAKVRSRFGGALLYFVSGGAALNPKIAEFFTALGVGILQGYGQTEASPVVSVNRPGAVRTDTVGPPLPGVEVRLSEAGELLVKGPIVMQGYWKAPEATAATLNNGWLHTGDLAEIDPDGHIRIVGRIKDLIINSGGENIAPAPLEAALMFHPDVAQAVVVGDGRPWLSALIVLSETARERGESKDSVVRAILKSVNADQPAYLHVRKAVAVDEPCTLENGLLTPTQKIKRHQWIAAHQDALDALY